MSEARPAICIASNVSNWTLFLSNLSNCLLFPKSISTKHNGDCEKTRGAWQASQSRPPSGREDVVRAATLPAGVDGSEGGVAGITPPRGREDVVRAATLPAGVDGSKGGVAGIEDQVRQSASLGNSRVHLLPPQVQSYLMVQVSFTLPPQLHTHLYLHGCCAQDLSDRKGALEGAIGLVGLSGCKLGRKPDPSEHSNRCSTKCGVCRV